MFQQPLWRKASAFKFGLASGAVVVVGLALVQSVLPLSLIPTTGGELSTWLASLVGAALGGMLISGVVFLTGVAVRNAIVRLRFRGSDPMEYTDGRWPVLELGFSGFLSGALLFCLFVTIPFLSTSGTQHSSDIIDTAAVLIGAMIVSGIMGALYLAAVGACRNLFLF